MKKTAYQKPMARQVAIGAQYTMMAGSETYEQPAEGELPEDSELQSNRRTGNHNVWDDWEEEDEDN